MWNNRYWAVAWAVVVGGVLTSSAHGGVFVTTGHTGAQDQCDINHTRYWTYTLTGPVSGIDGGLFDMKDGSHTVEEITFTIFQGTIEDYFTATPLLEVTLGPGDFTKSYEPVLFEGAPINLQAHTTYTAVLASKARDPQDEAYFIKRGDLSFVNDQGNPVDPGGTIIPEPIPEPATVGVLGLGAMGLLLRRRR